MEESQLVRELTDKLETLQHEKHRLERAIEGQADSIALKLRLTLLAAGANDSSHHQGRHSHHAHSSQRRRKLSSTSPSSSISASSTTSASSSTSFPSSPSPLLSPILANSSSQVPNAPPDVLTALRENSELRTRLANSERVNQYYQREIADLRRRCGISIDELEELDPSLQASSHHPNSHPNGGGRSISGSRRRSFSSRSSQPNGSATVGSIRIPGASSVSPPSIRPSTSSYPSQQSSLYTNNGGNLPYSSSYSYSHSNYYPSQNPRFLPHSYTSSINTTLTTPSSSFPIANPPAPTPSTSLDLVLQDQTLVLPSPPQFNTAPSRGRSASIIASTSSSSSTGGRRLDLLPESPSLPATADTPTKLTIITSLDTSGGGDSNGNASRRRGREKQGANGKGKGKGKARALEEPSGSVEDDEDSWDEDDGEEDDEGEEVDPLVFAVTNSLKKLIAAQDPLGSANDSAGTRGLKIQRRNRRFSNEPPEEDEEDDEETGDQEAGGGESESESGGSSGGDGSSTTSREEDKYEEIRKEIIRLQRQIQAGSSANELGQSSHRREEVGNGGDEEEEGLTPLSVSPGSRARSRRESSASHR
ncbi:hypothetical protein JCM5353_001471 [Sporobolomyces roseus]